ncbi:Timeless family protein [Thalictrum thalictroides]|uniref:Timeless family protein n=1 Tax=Thalictrum thalictroides TaxID=46969 RepID=A0A7J6VNN9_THATH|nr:Timeless family protein [Thalictrum thalictroides]
MDLEGLSIICGGLGIIEENDNGERIGYTKNEFCLDNLKDLQRFLRRDDPQTRDVFNQVCKWNIVSKDLVPIIEHCQDDKVLVTSAVKILVFLTMPIEPTSNNISQQIDYLWELKGSLTRNDTIVVIVSLLEAPLENLEREAFSEDDWKLVQLVLTLFRNILAIHDISMQQKASGCATQYLSVRDNFLEILFNENVMELILALTQHVGGSCGYLRQDNLLFLDIIHYICLGQDPDLIVKASQKDSKTDEDVKASVDSLKFIIEEEEDKKRLARQRNVDRHSQFSGTFTRLTMDGSKSLCKGNPGMTSRDRLPKPHMIHRGPIKRIVGDFGKLASSKERILERLYDFVNQLLSGGYNELMESVREDIEKEHPAIQKNDVVLFFQVAQFVTAFQRQKFLLIKNPKAESGASEVFINKCADNTLFQGDICGPIAATMNEAMFLLVTSKWRYAFESLKETNDYKSLSAAGSLMKNMIRMLDLVLKLLPDDSKEPQTARILLYKIFYDQTEQGLTQFLVMLNKSFDTHKQPKSDLADLVEMIHVVLRLMENLQTRGTLRVSRKSKRGRKKKIEDNINVTAVDGLGDNPINAPDDGNLPCQQPIDSTMTSQDLDIPPTDSGADGKEESISVPNNADEIDIPPTETEDAWDESTHAENQEYSQKPGSLAFGTGDSSEDDLPAVTNEVDFKVSSFVSTFANNTIIQNLCWLLSFYKSNSISTNHYIICMLRRICDDLELSPMLYQLSLLTIFYDILAEQKSSSCKEYANIVSFLSSLVRKMMRKMKSQPLLFVEVLFWKTRRECHYINSESMMNELGQLKKGTSNWGIEDDEIMVPSKDNGRIYRSIADSLGEDEGDIMTTELPHMASYQNEKDSDGAKCQKLKHRDSTDERRTSNSCGIEAGNTNSDNAHNEQSSVEHRSHQDSKRKKRLVFDQELETDIKNLYEKFKDHKRCSHLIANALQDSGRILTTSQVSHKIKQLGLRFPKNKAMSDLDPKDLHLDDTEKESDEETLITLKRRRKTNTKSNMLSEKAISGNPKFDMKSITAGDDSDDENLSSLLVRTHTTYYLFFACLHGLEKLEVAFAGLYRRDEHTRSTETNLPHDNVNLNHDDLDDGALLDQSIKNGAEVGVADNRQDEEMHDRLDDELEDSGDDVEPLAPNSSVVRRKLKMVIDLEDDE